MEPTWLLKAEIWCLRTKEGLGAAVPWLPKAHRNMSSNQGNFMLEPAQDDELLPNNWLLKGPDNSAAPLGAGAAWLTLSCCLFGLIIPNMNVTIVVKWETHRLKAMCPAQHTLTFSGALKGLHIPAAHHAVRLCCAIRCDFPGPQCCVNTLHMGPILG